MATNYHDTKEALTDFLARFQKLAEDPNREALEPEDMKEGKPQTEETDKGDGTAAQGAAGKETSQDIKENSTPPGTSVEGDRKNTGAPAAMENAKSTNMSPVKESESPDEDIDKMKNVEPAVKKACAQQIILENRIMDILDRKFQEYANKNASAQAEDKQEQPASKEAADAYVAAQIIEAAEQHKAAHVQGLVKELGCSAKVANEILNQVADEDPEAILPADTLSDEDAEAILAEAAAEDAALAEEAALGEDVGAVDPAEIEAALTPIIEEMKAAGYEDGEILQAILEEAEISEEDIVETAIEQLVSEGLSEDEALEVIQSLGELQAQGATPEELAEILSGGAE